jgi:toxin HigB-1
MTSQILATAFIGARGADRAHAASVTPCRPYADGLRCGMIKRFRHKGLGDLFRTGSTKGVNPQLASKLRRILLRLDNGPLPDAMRLPGFRLHQLKGDREGTWSLTVSGNWRVTFEIEGEDATNVDLEDYH